ncbi:MAG: hypothetical protein LPK28_00895 [Bacteroidota bacterium]|nr:hypothetical protein [Bacteroidota bacterium]
MNPDLLIIVVPLALYLGYRAFLYWIPDPLRYTARFHQVEFLPHGQKKAMELSEEALKRAGFRITGRDERSGDLYAETRFSMSSWKEGIVVSFSEVPSGTRIDLISICKVPTQIVDWGKNRRNARRFFSALGRN